MASSDGGGRLDLLLSVLWFVSAIAASGVVWEYRTTELNAGFWVALIVALGTALSAVYLTLWRLRMDEARRLAGAAFYLPYVPYGESVFRIIYAANSGPVSGDGFIWTYLSNGDPQNVDIGAVPAHSVTQLSAVIDAGIAAMQSSTSGKYSVFLLMSVPYDDVDVFAAYNVGGSDRVAVPVIKKLLSDEQWFAMRGGRPRWWEMLRTYR